MTQPNKPFYSPDELNLFKEYNRESYFMDYGIQAPPYNPGLIIKTWKDSDITDDSANYNYNVLVKTSDGAKLMPLVVGGAMARTVNLPGQYTYPAYVVKPTDAVFETSSGHKLPVNANKLATMAEAEALKKEIGANPVFAVGEIRELDLNNPVSTLNYGTESRRYLTISVNGKDHTVGEVLRMRHKAGVGAPGQWGFDLELQWRPDTPTDFGLNIPTSQYMQLPKRPLLSNEKLMVGFGGLPLVVRTDMESEFNHLGNVLVNGPADTGLEDRLAKLEAQIATLQASLEKLLGFFGAV